ncbi:bifunctional adenosylcobinamide kinase/adenosylcobinamide-phosphate guanylyltransferase [Candidatus Puniceispirillum sp.]|nr:bifunctional adenosylcobinamide kinase/adenosylcobinamide-phosphate guanylyltransferase [Candidatus Puniceispirillum sp.]
MIGDKIQFVLGGARSGKSQFAETLALQLFCANKSLSDANAAKLVYIATAVAFDDEMQARIDLHKERRESKWQLSEAPIELPTMIRAHDAADNILLVDCTSIWITNLLINNLDTEPYRQDLISCLNNIAGKIILVASETGLGIVPDDKLSRQFRDANGLNNQAIATAAQSVFFLIAGIAQKVKAPNGSSA